MFWYVAATASCLLGMATKELVATAPVIVLLYDRTFLAGSFREAWRRRYGLYLALAATWGMIAFAMISTGFYGGTAGFGIQKFTTWRYLADAAGRHPALPPPVVLAVRVVPRLRLAAGPGARSNRSSRPCRGWAARANRLALVKRPAWGFLGAWFFVILAPTSSIMPIQDVAFEHRMYLSLAAMVVGRGGGQVCRLRVCRSRNDSTGRIAGSGASLGLFAATAFATLTFQRNTDYRTALSILAGQCASRQERPGIGQLRRGSASGRKGRRGHRPVRKGPDAQSVPKWLTTTSARFWLAADNSTRPSPTTTRP